MILITRFFCVELGLYRQRFLLVRQKTQGAYPAGEGWYGGCDRELTVLIGMNLKKRATLNVALFFWFYLQPADIRLGSFRGLGLVRRF